MATENFCVVHDLGRRTHFYEVTEVDMLWKILAAFGSGTLGAMGMGGGGILVIFLTLALSMPQLKAQGVNLLFFLPCAVISLIINGARGLVDWRTAGWIVLGGIPTAFLGIWLAGKIDMKWLAWLFATFLIIVGVKELFSKAKQQEN
jgi:uncharacterized membrane protein YfcA